MGSLAIPLLESDPRIKLAGLIHVKPRGGRGGRSWKRTLRKLRAIGPLGALNGARMRRWYGEDLSRALALEPVDRVARELGVPVFPVPGTGSAEAEGLIRGLGVDAVISLGNGYIPERVYAVPRLGTVNVHHELLPHFRGAQGVIWQLHEGSSTTGFTVHSVDKSLDTGAILYREEVPILFKDALGATVTATMAESYRRSAERLPDIVSDLERLVASAVPQGRGRSFTTPSFRQFRRIRANHRRLTSGQ